MDVVNHNMNVVKSHMNFETNDFLKPQSIQCDPLGTYLFSWAKRRMASSTRFSALAHLAVFLQALIKAPEQLKKKPSCLGYVGDYTTQLKGDYNNPL